MRRKFFLCWILALVLQPVFVKAAENSTSKRSFADFFPPGGERLTASRIRCRLRILSTDETKALREGVQKDVPDDRDIGCRSESPVYLVVAESQWDSYDLRAIAQPVEGRLVPRTEIWPPKTYDAPVCPDCDEIWIGAVSWASSEFDSRYLLGYREDVSGPVLRDFALNRLIPHVPMERRFPAEYQGQSMMLMVDWPVGNRPALFAREAKRRGASRIVLHWTGARTYTASNYELQPPSGVRTIDYQGIKSSKWPMMLIDETPKEHRPGRMDPLIFLPDELPLGRRSLSRDLPLVYFSTHRWSPTPFAGLRKALSLGYRNVYWYRDGRMDWLERASWRTPPRKNPAE